MSRPLCGRGSIASLAIKPLLILALAISALFVAPAAASAAPAGKVTTIAADQALASVSGTESSRSAADAGINAVFSCNYFSRSPFQVISFSCVVQSGTFRIILTCADGRQIFGPILGPAVGAQNFSLNCAPSRISTFRAEQFS